MPTHEGEGGIYEGEALLARVRYRLEDGPADQVPVGPGGGTIEGMREPPSGRIEALDGTDLASLKRRTVRKDIWLRGDDGHAMRCKLVSDDGEIEGGSAWWRKPV